MTDERSLTTQGMSFPATTRATSGRAKEVQKIEQEIAAILGGEVTVARMGVLATGIIEDSGQRVFQETMTSMIQRRNGVVDDEVRGYVAAYVAHRAPRFIDNMDQIVDAVCANVVAQMQRSLEPPEKRGWFNR